MVAKVGSPGPVVQEALSADTPAARDPYQGREKLIRVKDLIFLCALPLMTAISWLCSDRFCERLARGMIRLFYRIQPSRYAEHAQFFREYLPRPPNAADLDKLIEKTASLIHLERLQLLRYYRPGGWQPCIQLAGLEHLEAALRQGRGAILWVTPTSFSDMVTKVALRHNGFMVWHLSRHTHGGFSSTRFGILALNSIRLRMECRYLAARVVIDPHHPGTVLNRLVDLLAQNRVVSVTVGAEAKRITMVRLGRGSLPLAGGVPNLAIRTGALLLPIFTERRPDNSFLVTIAAPLEVPTEASLETRVTKILNRFAASMELNFLRLPEQYECLGPFRIKRMLKQQGPGRARLSEH